jgi:hypothetical protein
MQRITAGSGLRRYHSAHTDRDKKARFTPAHSGNNAAYRRWTGLMAPLIVIFTYLDTRSVLEVDRAAAF